MRCSFSYAITLVMLLSAVAIVAAGGDGGQCSSSHYASGDKCLACPDCSWSPKGSDSIQDCVCWNNYERQSDGSCQEREDRDGGWCPLSTCSASCGCGVQTRVCGCPSKSGNGKDCEGPATVPCVADACVGTEVCPPSTFSPTGSYIPGQTTCTSCGEFAWSPAGSTSIAACSCWSGYSGQPGSCVEVTPAVNGGWCNATECSATCGGGTQTRVCGCPAPAGTGAQCKGASVIECASCACEVEGVPCPASTYSSTGKYIEGSTTCTACPANSWSPIGSKALTDCQCWSGFTGPAGGPCTEVIPSVPGGWCPVSVCNATCGGGLQTRSCSCPPRSGDGADCEGPATLACNTEPCVRECPAGTYSSTGFWDCRSDLRCKKCPKYSWAPAGSDSKSDCVCWEGYEKKDGSSKCTKINEVPHVDGGWCPATECSATCGGGTQTRECACPAPEGTGAACKGEATVACNDCACDAPSGSKPCPTSTYSASGMYQEGSSECTPCPANSWSPSGSKAITDCGCWVGYEGPAGGPCAESTDNIDGGWCGYAACSVGCGGGVKARMCGCPRASGNGTQCVGEIEAPCNTEACADVTCSTAADEAQCNSWGGCSPVQGFDCAAGRWSAYLGCQNDRVPPQQTQTCAVNSDSGARAWMPSALLPAGYVATTTMGDVQSCCVPEVCNSTRPPKAPGCTFELGGACVVLQFRGECPINVEDALRWAAAFLQELAANIDTAQLAELARVLSQYVRIVHGPTPNNGTSTFSCTLQIAPFNGTLSSLTPDQVVAAIMKLVHAGGLSATSVASQLQGVASYSTFATDQTPSGTDSGFPVSAAGGLAHASLMLVLATGVIGTIVAKVAAFMQ